MNKILFISHDTSRSGSPFVLLQFLKWIKHNNSQIDITIVTLKGGSLSEDFKKYSKHYIDLSEETEKESSFINNKLLRTGRLFKKKDSKKERILQYLAAKNFPLIYANSISTIPFAAAIKEINSKTKLVAHIHELETVVDILLPDFKKYISQVDSFIAASLIVKESLHSNFGIPSQLITTFYEFSPLQIRHDKPKQGVFTIGGAGTVDWRKGVDFFIQVAYIVNKALPLNNLKWLWVGKIDPFQKKIFTKDIEKAGLQGKVLFMGEKQDLREYFSNIDVFLLPSREDPFPLVAIEAAMNKVPIICFEGATGTAEILRQGGGKVVPYMDVYSMGETIIEYCQNKKKRLSDGNDAQRLFSNFTPENICPEIFSYLKSL